MNVFLSGRLLFLFEIPEIKRMEMTNSRGSGTKLAVTAKMVLCFYEL